jgi:hypothetical protein
MVLFKTTYHYYVCLNRLYRHQVGNTLICFYGNRHALYYRYSYL